MDIFLSLLLLALGLLFVAKGGDWFVDSAVKIAKALKIPTMIIGATIVSIGTTLPELLTSLFSVIMGKATGNIADYNAIAIGNSIGSILCNVGLIMGFVLMVKPVSVGSDYKSKSICFMLMCLVVMVVVITGGGLVVYEGIILLILFIGYYALNIAQAMKSRKMTLRLSPEITVEKINFACIIKFVVAALAIALGAYLLVDNAKYICTRLGIPAQIIGVTVVAIGTSIPEFVTNIIALKRGESELGLGNILGANIINGCLLLGMVTCVGGGIAIDAVTRMLLVFFALAMAIVITIPTLATKKLKRWQGIAVFLMYIVVITINIIFVLHS